ncbi:PLP-dependent aminotransferase family protein [uncultured Ruthenibacterium sp.]|uniref:MocR-like pyridoxine biosynthesis transcription factor PdxR n=1 Tax=uncultured Ruthenibacterium sp. TaxID=1905347 RepID=UPI00349EB26D
MEDLVFVPQAGSKTPLYQQLYTYFVQSIRTGRLAPGEKLPSKRRLAEQLELSVNTVDTAYQMLTAEGYLVAKPRSGFVVQKLWRLTAPAPAAKVEKAPAPPLWRYNFETASIDTKLFPFKTWRRIQRDVVGEPRLLNHGPRSGDEELRAAIARHLREARAARCEAEQIVVGAGIEYLLGILARLFAGRLFAVEDPGYARTHRILANNGTPVTFVPVDEQGMSARALAKSGAQLAYVTPSHQFPTGVTMPVGRRTELLQWAQSAPGRYVIEDDYDSEFRFDGRPIPCMQGLDEAGKVIYISTFSKSVAPAIRIGYMVLPAELLEAYRQRFGFYSCTVSRFEQQTLSRFMDGGWFSRHLARLRAAYRGRRDALVAALDNALADVPHTVRGSHTGLHLLLQVHTNATEAELVERAAAQSVHLTGLSDYYHGPCPASPTLVLGYAGLAPEDIEGAAQALGRAWAPLTDARPASV